MCAEGSNSIISWNAKVFLKEDKSCFNKYFQIPALFLLTWTAGRFSIFSVLYAYVLRVCNIWLSPEFQWHHAVLPVISHTILRTLFQGLPPQIPVVPFTLMPCLFQLLLITFFMPSQELSLPILTIEKKPQTLFRHLHWLVLISDIKLKLCPLSAGLCRVSASMHLSFLLCACFNVTLMSSILKKKIAVHLPFTISVLLLLPVGCSMA